eukprot:scaffold86082_cov28-Tisochrysis_lutea.AAC.4
MSTKSEAEPLNATSAPAAFIESLWLTRKPLVRTAKEWSGPSVSERQQASSSTASRARQRARAARWHPSQSTTNGTSRWTALPHPLQRTANGPARHASPASVSSSGGSSAGGGGSHIPRAPPATTPTTAGSSSTPCSASSPPAPKSGGDSSCTAAPTACVVMTTVHSAPTSELVVSRRASAAYCTTARPAREAEKSTNPMPTAAKRIAPKCFPLSSGVCFSSAAKMRSCPIRSRAGASSSAIRAERVNASPHTVGMKQAATCGPIARTEKARGLTP